MRNSYNILIGKSEGKQSLGRLRRRGKDNIRMDLGEIVWEDVNCMHLAQNRDEWRYLVNAVMNLRIP
jgi:hypothetical protein